MRFSHKTTSRRVRQKYAVETLESRELLAGVTIITHGFTLGTNPTDGAGWITHMADAIQDKVGTGFAVSQYVLKVNGTDSGGPTFTALTRVAGSPAWKDNASGEAIIRIDWSDLDAVGSGLHSTSTESVGNFIADDLFASTIDGVRVSEVPIHLIGHSRGASLMTQLAYRFAQRGIWVDQVTSLDPHPVDGVNEPLGMGDFSDTPMAIWDNTVFADNYWRSDGLNSFDFTGEAVSGGYNTQLSENVLSGAGYALEHSDVHLWYHGTADPIGTIDDGAIHFDPDTQSWYGSPSTRASRGYYFSRIAGGTRPTSGSGTGSQFGGASTRVSVAASGPQSPNIGMLALEDSPAGIVSIYDEMFISFRYQDRDGGGTITFFAENGDDESDRNPYNGPAQQLGSPQAFGTTATAVEAGSFHAPINNLAPGKWLVYAKITDGFGKRYEYLKLPITVIDNPPATPITTGERVNGSVPAGGISSHIFSVKSGESITVAVARLSGAFVPKVELYSPSGQRLALSSGVAGSSVAANDLTQTGSYTVVVSDYWGNDGGSYTMTGMVTGGTEDIGGDGGILVSDRTQTASIDAADVDMFTVTAGEGDPFTISVADISDGSFTPLVRVFGPNGGYLAQGNGSIGTSVTVTATQAGTYFVVVTDYWEQYTGDYALTLAHVPGVQQLGDDGGPLAIGRTQYGTIGAGDVDVLTFSAGIGDAISISLADTSGNSFTPLIRLYSPNGDYVAQGNGSVGTSVNVVALRAGTFYAVISDYWEQYTGRYAVTLSRVPGAQASGSDGGALISGRTQNGTIAAGDIDVFTFTAGIGESISISLADTSSSSFTPWLSLYAPNGAYLAQGNGSVGTSVVVDAPQAGTYYAVVKDYWAQYTGSYAMTLARLPGVQDVGGDGGTIFSGHMRGGAIGAGDIDIFTFTASPEDMLSLVLSDTSGSSFTPLLRLYGPNGEYLRQANGGISASFTATASKVGTYYAVVSDYWDQYTGNYVLTMNRFPDLNSADPADGDGGATNSGSSFSGSITLGDLDVYTLSLPVGSNLSVQLVELVGGASFTPQISVYRPNGSLLATNNGSSSASLALTNLAIAGVYYLVVNEFGNDAVGHYSLGINAPPGADARAPELTSLRVDRDSAIPGFTVTVSEAIGDATNAPIPTVTNLTTNTVIPATSLTTTFNSSTNEIFYSFVGTPGGSLPDGNYRVSFTPGSVLDTAGNASLSPFTFDFFVFKGDANHDRKIDADDLAVLSSNWQGELKTFSEGDFNYDGKVDISDLYIVATKWQQTMPPPPLPAIPAITKPPQRRTPVRILS